MEKFLKLIKQDFNELNENENNFIICHEQIIDSGRLLTCNIIDFATKLKSMKDNKYYLSAGFETFKEYLENCTGIKERQAYNYINLLEKLPVEFLHSNAKIGITKLNLLADLTEEERNQIIDNVDIDSSSVSDLKNKINELEISKIKEKKKFEKLKKSYDDLKNKPIEVKVEYRVDPSSEEKIKTLNDDLNLKQQEIDILKKENKFKNEFLIEFKVRFNSFQNSLAELLESYSKINDNDKLKCKKAIECLIKGIQL